MRVWPCPKTASLPNENTSAFPKDSTIFTALCPLFLASSSPRRIAFLQDMGLEAKNLPVSEQAEPAPLPGEDPERYALRAAKAKAFDALPRLPADAFALARPALIAADTVVSLAGRILGKPGNPEQAYAMLEALAGKRHSVITACFILRCGPSDTAPCPHSFAVKSRVHMWDAPPDLLRAYANSTEPVDKAGAYAVQGKGAVLVRSIEGSWSNVVGLPLAELTQALLHMRLIAVS